MCLRDFKAFAKGSVGVVSSLKGKVNSQILMYSNYLLAKEEIGGKGEGRQSLITTFTKRNLLVRCFW